MTPHQILSLVEKKISQLNFGEAPPSLYEPIHYIMGLGGKRLRPLLACLSYSLYRKDVIRIIPMAVAVEVFHNFTLMHDDIMDQAPLRRGKDTVHKKWNVNTAILSGDVMLVRVYDLLLSAPPEKLKSILKLFNRTASAVCEGQQWDMEFESIEKVSEAEYLEMIRLKTAVLLGFSLELGALLAGASTRDCKALYRFGVRMGMGFQLMDDLLDVYGDQKQFGKQVGGDITSNKKTFLLIKAQEMATGKVKKELTKWTTGTTINRKEKVKTVMGLYDQLSIRELTEKKIEFYFKSAYRQLDRLDVKNKKVLQQFTEKLAARQK